MSAPKPRLTLVEKLEILGKSYNFSLKLYTAIANFDNRYKFAFRKRLITLEEEIEEYFIEANRTPDVKEAAEYVHKALTNFDKIVTKLRKAVALGQMSPGIEGLLLTDIDEITGDAKKWRTYFLNEYRRKEGRSSGGENHAVGSEPI